MKNTNRNNKKSKSSVSRKKKKVKGELQDLKKEKKQLEVVNEKLKKKKEQLEQKIDNLKEENRKLLHKIEDRDGETEEIGIRLPSDSVIKGDIESERDINVENEVRIVGSLRSKKDIILGYGNQIKGDVVSENGDVKVGNTTKIGGIVKGEKIHLAEGVESGQIKCEEKLIIDDNCEVLDIFALGDVDIGENVKIDGTIRHAGDFSVSRGINVTNSIVPKPREELAKEAEKDMASSLPFLPMIIREGFGKTEEEMGKEEKEEVDKESVRDKIDEVRNLIKSARDGDINISEEKSNLKEGVSLFKKGEYAEAEDRFTKCKHSLKRKLNKKDEDEKSEEGEEKQESKEKSKE
ncbi:MAG: polymer-forming cytoskeletal protein [Candidatus Thermoplasmatota archaeon]